MAMYPNGRFMSRSPGRHFGVAPGLDVYYRGRGDRFNTYASDTHLKTASTPDGYDIHALVPARTAGSMAALVPVVDAAFVGALLQGGPMEGAGAFGLAAPNSTLSLVVGMSGSATLTFLAPSASLRLVVGLDGQGVMTLTGAGGLSMIVPFDGTGAMTLTGAGDLRGRMSMEGSWTPFSELSPESLAAAVWQAVAAVNNEPDSMGARLNTASSGGVDLNTLAQAVWSHGVRTLTSGGTSAPTVEQIAAAVLAAAQAAPIHADTRDMNGAPVVGTGTEGDPWRGVGVPP